MSDSDKPQDQQPQPTPYPDRPRPDRERLRQGRQQSKVPQLDQGDHGFGFGKKVLMEDVEGELAEALGGSDIEALMGQQTVQKKQPPAPAGPRKGKVISIRGKDVFLDVGGRTQGVLPIMQFTEGPPIPGTEVEVQIEGYDPDGFLILTRKGAAVEADWSSVTEGMTVEARVTATNKGGLSVDVNGIRGFMPMAQIDLYRVEDAAGFINQKLLCLVAEVDREERNLVVSRRAYLEKERETQREKLWQTIDIGQKFDGIVRSIKPFGAFVDLGGADGLLPVGEISWSRINDPSDILKPGQKVTVQVIRLDRDTRKITLGLRQLLESPFDKAATRFPLGSIVQGKVTRTTDFGAFVELEPGLEGLIHISELAPQRVRRVQDVVQVGQIVSVMILNVDSETRRIALSLKAAKVEAPEPEESEDEDGEPIAPVKKRTTPLRGGVGSREFLSQPPEDTK